MSDRVLSLLANANWGLTGYICLGLRDNAIRPKRFQAKTGELYVTEGQSGFRL
jgi:hypothetical protein